MLNGSYRTGKRAIPKVVFNIGSLYYYFEDFMGTSYETQHVVILYDIIGFDLYFYNLNKNIMFQFNNKFFDLSTYFENINL